jgi:hypothetical protein
MDLKFAEREALLEAKTKSISLKPQRKTTPSDSVPRQGNTRSRGTSSVLRNSPHYEIDVKDSTYSSGTRQEE